jgi:hypothetical protein
MILRAHLLGLSLAVLGLAAACSRGRSLTPAEIADAAARVAILRERYADTTVANEKIREFLAARSLSPGDLETAIARLRSDPDALRQTIDSLERALIERRDTLPR